MIETKKRINISVSKDIDNLLNQLAKRDAMPVATKALDLIKQALLVEEDIVLDLLAQERDKKTAKYFTHEQAWK